MDKKISYVLAILIPILIVAAIFLAFPRDKPKTDTVPEYNTDWASCSEDSDCIVVSSHPCGDYPCGGLTINGNYSAEYQTYLNELTAYYNKIGKTCSPNCLASEEKIPKCVNSKCVVDKETSEPARTKPFAKTLADAANAMWGREGVIYPATSEIANEGWFRNSFNVPEGAEYSNICYIFSRGELRRTTDNLTFFLDYGAVNVSGSETCKMEVAGGPVSQCGKLTLYMDLEAMKTSYDRAQDNWDDFITCESSIDSTFCKSECKTLLETLMFQERYPMQ